jgi:hypothetical protein
MTISVELMFFISTFGFVRLTMSSTSERRKIDHSAGGRHLISKKPWAVSALNYMVTSNQVHLQPSHRAITAEML